MIEILKAILFGIVEGITEWLPISSTGHMILLNEIVSLNVSDEFYSMFEVVIQLGAILAVVILFWNQIWPFGKKDNKEPLAKTGAPLRRQLPRFPAGHQPPVQAAGPALQRRRPV